MSRNYPKMAANLGFQRLRKRFPPSVNEQLDSSLAVFVSYIQT